MWPAYVAAIKASRRYAPTDSFRNGEKGFWYDPSDTSTTFQDTAGTTPATANGATVSRINDKSGNGAHQLLISGQTAYTLNNNTAIKTMDTAGSGGMSAASAGLTGTKLSLVLAVTDASTNVGYWLSLDTADSAWSPQVGTNPSFANGFWCGRDPFNGEAGNANISSSAASPVVLVVEFDMTAASNAAGLGLEVNGTPVSAFNGTWAAISGAMVSGNKLSLGAGVFAGIGGGAFRPISAGGFAFGLGVNRSFTASEKSALRTLAGSKVGLTL